jgi:hypothetical protein
MTPGVSLRVPDARQPFGPRVGEEAKEHCGDNGEHRRACPDAEGRGRHR